MCLYKLARGLYKDLIRKVKDQLSDDTYRPAVSYAIFIYIYIYVPVNHSKSGTLATQPLLAQFYLTFYFGLSLNAGVCINSVGLV